MNPPADILAKYVAKLDELSGDDPESAHAYADGFIVEALKELRLSELSDAWERVDTRCEGFWYA